MDFSRIKFDGRTGKIIFHGTCLEMHPFCQAFCCRKDWAIVLNAEEFAGRQYQAQAACVLTDKECHVPDQPCPHRRYQVAKHRDNSCVYLEGNLCSIYETRPRACRLFRCEGGLILNPSAQPEEIPFELKPFALTRDIFLERVRDDHIFLQHPLVKLHTVFCLKAKREIVFVKELVGSCGKFNTRDAFDYPQLDDVQIMQLIHLFSRKEPLKLIHQMFCRETSAVLTKRDFFEIVWLLNRHNLVLDSRNFQGMLAGVGAVG
jgi:hypothetical protein